MTALRNITVLGTGVLGSQIAYQTAYRGFDVVAYDIDDAALEAAKQRFARDLARFNTAAAATPVAAPANADAPGRDPARSIRSTQDSTREEEGTTR